MKELNGKRFVAWVEDRRPGAFEHLSATHQRAWRDYVAGVRHATERTADAICCVLDIHLREIPEDLYLPTLSRFDRRLIMRDLKAGFWPTEIARMLDMPVGTVQRFAS